jgi:hypothetical protein
MNFYSFLHSPSCPFFRITCVSWDAEGQGLATWWRKHVRASAHWGYSKATHCSRLFHVVIHLIRSTTQWARWWLLLPYTDEKTEARKVRVAPGLHTLHHHFRKCFLVWTTVIPLWAKREGAFWRRLMCSTSALIYVFPPGKLVRKMRLCVNIGLKQVSKLLGKY